MPVRPDSDNVRVSQKKEEEDNQRNFLPRPDNKLNQIWLQEESTTDSLSKSPPEIDTSRGITVPT